MSVEINKRAVSRVFEEAFNQGDLTAIDEGIASDGRDHQHPGEPSFPAHLKQVVTNLRTAFPDLHFEIVQIIGEGDWVAAYVVMTGTHTGELRMPDLPRPIPPTGNAIRVPHMHMVHCRDGKGIELYHLMETTALMAQLNRVPALSAN